MDHFTWQMSLRHANPIPHAMWTRTVGVVKAGDFLKQVICGETGKRLERKSQIADFFTDV
jgi:hypothetical protein